VPRDDEVVAERRELRRRIRRVDDREPEAISRPPRCDAQIVPRDVRVVEPEDLDRRAAEIDLPPHVA
jgi:hypothetical protein